MRLKPLAIADYETKKIGKRPDESPPYPVGCAIREPGKRPRYYAWGHPCENNCTFAEFKKVMRRVTKQYRVCYHNAKFDTEVSEKHLGLPLPRVDEFEDTMFLAYLRNPRERNLKLKDLSDKWLDMPPEEAWELRDWIVANVKGARENNWGEYISEAPGKLVGKYAIGDIVRTEGLYKEFHPYVKDHGMLPSYIVEKDLVRIVIDMERKGVPIAVKALAKDLQAAHIMQDKAVKSVCRKLGVKEFNPGAPTQVIPLFEEAGLVHPDDWIRGEPTPKMIANGITEGNIRIGIEQLEQVCNNKRVIYNMKINSKLNKLIGTYMEPWLEQAEQYGVFYPWFNQIRADNDLGTKSGRFSSNFQQVPKEPYRPQDHDIRNAGLPFMRNYVVPDSSKHILLRRDFKQQEVRILAYYEEEELYNAFLSDNNLDVHDLVSGFIKERTGMSLSRGIVKTCNFLMIYGGGAPALSAQLGIPLDEAAQIVRAHNKALPGPKELSKEVVKTCRRGDPIFTIGGREYYAERGFEWRMLNMLIQGGAADHTKRSMIRIYDALQDIEDTRIMVTVHDEFIVSTPTKLKKQAMTTFRDAMDADTMFDPMPMISDGKWGKTWGGAVTCPI